MRPSSPAPPGKVPDKVVQRAQMTDLTNLAQSAIMASMKTTMPPSPLKALTATKAKATFSSVLDSAGHRGQRILVKKGARPTAVILGYEDYQRLAELEDRFESALLTKSLKEDRFLSLDEVTKRLGL